MDPLISPREKTLGTLTLVLGLLFWAALIIGTVGVALAYVLLGFIAYVFAQSAWVAWVRGTAVRISPEQFPELHERLQACTQTLRMDRFAAPEAYLLNGNGLFNAFALRFFGQHFVVLLSDTVEALAADPQGINFYIGHELGHIRAGHLTGRVWRLPALWLPLLGAAYARAKETTCDRHGRACCVTPEIAARALVALGAGREHWQAANLDAYVRQIQTNQGFWGSFHEIVSGYPWLTKRVARVLEPGRAMPGRNPLAYVLGLFVPHGFSGGGGVGALVAVAMVGVLAAVALPAYSDYTQRAHAANAWVQGAPVREALATYYTTQHKLPASLSAAGVAETLPDGSSLELSPRNMVVAVRTKHGTLMMVPAPSDAQEGAIEWHCAAGEGLRPAVLPASCRK